MTERFQRNSTERTLACPLPKPNLTESIDNFFSEQQKLHPAFKALYRLNWPLLLILDQLDATLAQKKALLSTHLWIRSADPKLVAQRTGFSVDDVQKHINATSNSSSPDQPILESLYGNFRVLLAKKIQEIVVYYTELGYDEGQIAALVGGDFDASNVSANRAKARSNGILPKNILRKRKIA